ncbi:MAG: TIGR02757 family protein [Planctomycetota bacterium]
MSNRLDQWTETFDVLYARWNRPHAAEGDPVRFPRAWDDPRDREVVALLAASLSYGRVGQILAGVRAALERLGERPARAVFDATPAKLARRMRGFRHRFATGEHVAAMLCGAGRLVREHGSLGSAFAAGASGRDETLHPALRTFAARLDLAAGGACGHLLADPSRRSACKRWWLMLRWLVRRDDVDPGGWDVCGPERLIIPLDTHMHRLGHAVGATSRRSANLATAMDLTAAFRSVAPHDPTRYDFALTHAAIAGDADLPCGPTMMRQSKPDHA